MSLKRRKIKKKISRFAIFDTGVIQHIDALQVSLLRAGKNTLLPELYDIFGKECLLKFLDTFAGTTIQVPTKKVLEDAIRDTYIYLTITENDKSRNRKKSDIVKELAVRYDMDVKDVISVYKDMQKHY